MERELRGTWSVLVADSGRSDTLIVDFAAWTEDDRLTGWSLALRTARCPAPVHRRTASAGEAIALELRCCELVVRGALQCVATPRHTAMIEAPQLNYGFPSAMRTVLGTLVELVPGADPPDPPPPVPPGPPGLDDPSPIPVAVIGPASARGGELFPYVYMQLWPAPPADELARGFVDYPYPLDAAPSGALVQALAQLRAAGGPDARDAMQRAAIAYLDAGTFDRPLALACFPEIQQLAAGATGDDASAVVAQIFAALGMTCADAVAWQASEPYVTVLAAIWQRWFALVIELGYQARERDALAQLLVADHVVRYLTARCGELVAGAALAEVGRATLVLPAGLFPLPPSGALASASPPAPAPPITPYAIGELQMVQQRLVGYQLGDIARIESVMPGERRKVVHRHKRSVTQHASRATRDVTRHDSQARTQALTSELTSAIADVLQTTSYGDSGFSVTYGTSDPPKTQLAGGWSVETRPGAQGPSQSEVSRAVRRVVEQAADRVARRVVETRSTSRVESSEDASISVLDNTAGAAPRRGVWRWLDEVYEASIVRYGNRLVFELLIARPAAAYLARDTELPADAYPPVPPAALGIESFEDITRDRFPLLAARYPSEALTLPPPPCLTVSGWARSGSPLALSLPDGYAADTAAVSYAVPSGAGPLEIRGVIGGAAVAIDAIDSGSARFALAGETGTVQVLLLIAGLAASPPIELEPVQLAVEITCKPSQTAMDAWQLRTYQALQASYAAQRDAWQGGAPSDIATAGATASPVVQPRLSWRAIERRELTRGALDLLFDALHDRTGGDDSPSGTPRGVDFAEPRQLQFFERTFEWSELSYRVIQGARRRTAVAALGDERFLAFLEADWAQVLLPVAPGDARAVLYFLASGMLWDGDAAWIPAHASDVALVNQLHKLRPGPRELRPVGAPWQVVVPTTHSVLQDGELITEPRHG